MTIPLALRLLTGSSRQPGPLGAKLPCRKRRAIPIRRCSRWGLPCRFGCPSRGGLLPHRFTLTLHAGRFVLCGAFRRVAPPGRYPAPSLHGVRTFLARPAIRRSGAMSERGHPAIRARLPYARKAGNVKTKGAFRPLWATPIHPRGYLPRLEDWKSLRFQSPEISRGKARHAPRGQSPRHALRQEPPSEPKRAARSAIRAISVASRGPSWRGRKRRRKAESRVSGATSG